MLSIENQRRAVPRCQTEEMRILNILFPRVEIKSETCRVFGLRLEPLRRNWPLENKYLNNCAMNKPHRFFK